MVIDFIIRNRVGFSDPFGFRPKEFIGAAIGAGLSLASSVIGGIKSAQANREAEKENKKWYARQTARNLANEYADDQYTRINRQMAMDWVDKQQKKDAGTSAVNGILTNNKDKYNEYLADNERNLAMYKLEKGKEARNAQSATDKEYSTNLQNYAQTRANNTAAVTSAASDALMKAGTAWDTASNGTDSIAKSNATKAAGKVDMSGIKSYNDEYQKKISESLNSGLFK